MSAAEQPRREPRGACVCARAGRSGQHSDTVLIAHRHGTRVAPSSVTVEMAIRRALESDGGAPVLGISRSTRSALMPHQLPGYEEARSRLLQEYADAHRVSVAAAARRLDFAAVDVDYTRARH